MAEYEFLISCFIHLFSLKPLIVWSQKVEASQLTTSTSVFDGLADVCAVSMAASINISCPLKSGFFICKKSGR